MNYARLPSIDTYPGKVRRQTKDTAGDDIQPRFELFLLGDGEKKVTEEVDTRTFSSLSLFRAT